MFSQQSSTLRTAGKHQHVQQQYEHQCIHGNQHRRDEQHEPDDRTDQHDLSDLRAYAPGLSSMGPEQVKDPKGRNHLSFLDCNFLTVSVIKWVFPCSSAINSPHLFWRVFFHLASLVLVQLTEILDDEIQKDPWQLKRSFKIFLNLSSKFFYLICKDFAISKNECQKMEWWNALS